MSDSKFTSLLQRLEAVTVRLEGMEKSAPAGSAPAASADDAPPSAMLADYDALLAGEVAAYVELAGKLGAADVEAQAKLVQQAFVAQREMLALVAKCKKPAEMGSIVQPTAEKIAAVQAAVDRRSASFNHLQALLPPLSSLPSPPTLTALSQPRAPSLRSGDGRVHPCLGVGDGREDARAARERHVAVRRVQPAKDCDGQQG